MVSHGSNVPKPGDEKVNSSKKDIFRYSYNLGKYRMKTLDQMSSIENIVQPRDMTGYRTVPRRKGITKSFSLDSDINLSHLENFATRSSLHFSREFKDISKLSIQHSNRRPMSAEMASVKQVCILPEENSQEQTLGKDFSGRVEDHRSDSNQEIKIDEGLAGTFDKMEQSVPNLRFTQSELAEKNSPEETDETRSSSCDELAISRPLLRFRRAARRLGVSLSSEELYHKQRRNGVCAEIDDAAESRNLLRVLNKRF